MLRKHKIDRKTAENWIRLYQEKAETPAHKMVVAAGPKPRQNGKKNTVKRTALDSDAWIEAAPEKKKDVSQEGRLPIECVFVLTSVEKQNFMDSVKQLGPLRATQVMYSAVVAAAGKSEI